MMRVGLGVGSVVAVVLLALLVGTVTATGTGDNTHDASVSSSLSVSESLIPSAALDASAQQMEHTLVALEQHTNIGAQMERRHRRRHWWPRRHHHAPRRHHHHHRHHHHRHHAHHHRHHRHHHRHARHHGRKRVHHGCAPRPWYCTRLRGHQRWWRHQKWFRHACSCRRGGHGGGAAHHPPPPAAVRAAAARPHGAPHHAAAGGGGGRHAHPHGHGHGHAHGHAHAAHAPHRAAQPPVPAAKAPKAPRKSAHSQHVHVAKAAEGSVARIYCEHGQQVFIVDASYGKGQGSKDSAGQFSKGPCHAQESFKVASQQCNHQTSCQLRATNGVFGAVCVGQIKSLKVTYVCQAPTHKQHKDNDYGDNTKPDVKVPRSRLSRGASSVYAHSKSSAKADNVDWHQATNALPKERKARLPRVRTTAALAGADQPAPAMRIPAAQHNWTPAQRLAIKAALAALPADASQKLKDETIQTVLRNTATRAAPPAAPRPPQAPQPVQAPAPQPATQTSSNPQATTLHVHVTTRNPVPDVDARAITAVESKLEDVHFAAMKKISALLTEIRSPKTQKKADIGHLRREIKKWKRSWAKQLAQAGDLVHKYSLGQGQ